jgi:hypothetical protein
MALGLCAAALAAGACDGGSPCGAARIEVRSRGDADAIADCREMSGRLIVNTVADLKRFELPNLEVIGVFSIVGNPALELVSLPKVRRIVAGVDPDDAHSTIDGNSALKTIDLGSLDHLGGDTTEAEMVMSLSVTNDGALQSLDLHSLRDAQKELVLAYTGGVTTVDLHKLAFARRVSVVHTNLAALDLPNLPQTKLEASDNAELASVSLTMADDASVTLTNNAKLTALELPRLARAEVVQLEGNLLGDVTLPALARIDILRALDNKGLRSLKAAAATMLVSDLQIMRNPELVDLDFAALATAAQPYSFGISDNPKLPDCEAVHVARAIGNPGSTIANNLGDGCQQ